MDHKHWEFETKAVHASTSQSMGEPTALPIHLSAAFSYKTAEDLADVFQGKKFGHVYSRISNPTVAAFEQKLNALEGGRHTIAVASGLSAITGIVLALCNPGDEIVISKSLFGGTVNLVDETYPKLGIKAHYVDITDVQQIKKAITSKTRAIFAEVIGNPSLTIPDMKAISEIAKSKTIPFILDTTLTTPYGINAKALGVSITVTSTTKYISGNGSVIGGALTDLGTFNWKKSRSEEIVEATKKVGDLAFAMVTRRHILHNIGSTLSPMNAYLCHNGLETLGLRIERHNSY